VTLCGGFLRLGLNESSVFSCRDGFDPPRSKSMTLSADKCPSPVIKVVVLCETALPLYDPLAITPSSLQY
jgi:hypothetical protein